MLRLGASGFDQWYDYATARSTVVMDDYDGIHQDLLPYWSLSPSQLRLRTWQMTSNPWNEISGISIRGGKAESGSKTLPTHRWMLEGVTSMMKPFAEWLPDMDVAFNLNDECRVALPWAQAEAMRFVGENAGKLEVGKDTSWSQNRAAGWRAVPNEPIMETVFEDLSFSNTFYTYGVSSCHPGSRARRQRVWDKRRLCLSCASPHSSGQFLQNWTLAGDICHQPDLVALHGFFLSPAAFKSTHELMPVFSQSKVNSYSDIL